MGTGNWPRGDAKARNPKQTGLLLQWCVVMQVETEYRGNEKGLMRLQFNWDPDDVVGHVPELMAPHVKKFLVKDEQTTAK